MTPSAFGLLRFLESHGLPKGGRVAVACSGGPDSVLLLALAREALPGRVACATYDHRLRKDSAADAAFVKTLCAAWDVPFLGGRGDVRGSAAKAKRGLEETARAMRYAFLEKARVKLGADFILTAHNLDDQAETVLFRAARGTKLTGLAGIPERQGNVLRPLLAASKAEILKELAKRKLAFRTDPTNADDAITRNFLRHEVVPRLERVNPGVRDALGRLASYAADLGAWVEGELAPLLHQDGHFGLRAYLSLPRALRGELVRMAFTRVTGSGDGLSEANLAEIDRFLHGPGNPRGKQMFGVRLEKRGQAVSFGKAPDAA